jgi:fucose permease
MNEAVNDASQRNDSASDPGRRYRATTAGCYVSYVVQAIVNTFVPLLFVEFSREFGITLGQLTLLTSVNFVIQLCVDLISVKFVDRIGYRASMILAHAFAFSGIACLFWLPDVVPGHFPGLMICMFLYACGGGLLEVLVSPLITAIPSAHKEAQMSLLHSFYCWGHAGVVLLSTLFFIFFGVANWRLLALAWSAVPLATGLLFIKLPIPDMSVNEAETAEEAKTGSGDRPSVMKRLLTSGMFWLFFAMMFFSGSAEQSIAQWVSAFAEAGLGIDKSLGDLVGPLMFAVTMGTSRLIFGTAGRKLSLRKYMAVSVSACILLYAGIILVPVPLVKLVFCGLCGFSVGIFWPGSFSLASGRLKGFGTPLFALLALAGDLGCFAGPGLVGLVSGLTGGNILIGIGAAILFPAGLLLVLFKSGRTCDKIDGGGAAG